MAYLVRLLRDSMSPNGHRLTTYELTFPRIVLAEFNTHRMLSRNSASSRAIPVEKMLERVKKDPFVPVYWGRNQKGMAAAEELGPREKELAIAEWLRLLGKAITSVEELAINLDVHKQLANRLLEPWLWHTAIVTGTDFDNLFNLRTEAGAQPEIQSIIRPMKHVHEQSQPDDVDYGEWHTPLVDDRDQLLSEGFKMSDIVRISTGRCARVSYLTQDGKREPKADIDMGNRMVTNGHMSPLEHPARPMTLEELDHYARWEVTLTNGEIYSSRHPVDDNVLGVDSVRKTFYCGNFNGWIQFRKTIPGEDVFIPPAVR